MSTRLLTILAIAIAIFRSLSPAHAEGDVFGSGKLLATGGVSTVEGAGGGGLAPWALITGYGTRDQIGADAHYTFVSLPDFTLNSLGTAIGFYDRLELSYAHQWFDTGDAGGRLGLGKGFTFEQDIFGAKLRVLGDAVYDQDRILPQIAVGTEYKVNNQKAVLKAVGARDDSGVDFYVAMTKLLLDESLLINATLRGTKANQTGILGFGGDRNDDYQAEFEGSLAYLVSRRAVVGAEIRTKPDNLGFSEENNWYDVFAAYFLTKNASVTIGYVNLGTIATLRDQQGFYLSLQAGF